jgi:hypothetical protein
VSGDVYRPAAIEQLKTVTKQAGAEWFPSSADQKPIDIARAAIDHARRHFFDVLLVDTAGRLAIDEVLMTEIKALHAELNPVETLFVVDAMQGQDAVNTAKAFQEALPLTGIILTKTDGDSRGGAALSVRQITGVPIKFAGTSEKIDGLEVFDAERHAGRILGMGDIVALVEQVTAGVDVAAAQKLAAKVKSGAGFDLNDFLSQLQQMKSMGGLSNLIDTGSTFGSVGPAISLPIFRGGLPAGRYREARARYDEAVATYDRIVIGALREVADAVTSRRQVAVQLAVVARFYERIGDHAVNLGDRVRFLVSGWVPERDGAARYAERQAASDSD